MSWYEPEITGVYITMVGGGGGGGRERPRGGSAPLSGIVAVRHDDQGVWVSDGCLWQHTTYRSLYEWPNGHQTWGWPLMRMCYETARDWMIGRGMDGDGI
jgi:hypothetical protein